MGNVFRFTYCQECGKRHRKPVETCACGCRNFRYSDWYIRVKVHGRNYEEKVGSKTLARQVLVKREAEVMDGKFKIKKDKKILMRDFALGDYWKIYCSRLKSSKNYHYNLKAHIIPTFGDYFLHQIETIDIERWLIKLDTKSYKVSSINRLLALIKSIYRQANKWKFTDNNPTSSLKLKTENNEVVRCLTKDQYHKLMSIVQNDNLKAAITLAIGTMLRKQNLFDLRWEEHVDMKNACIKIPGSMTKNKEAVVLPMIEPVFETLNTIIRHYKSPYIFVNACTGKPYKNYLYNHWVKAREQLAKIDENFPSDFRWHDLRHTGASWLAMAGVSDRTIMSLMNLKSLKVLKRYAHLTPDHVRKEAERISPVFSEEVGNRVDINAEKIVTD